ncbi:hypothetical protein KBZ94_37040 [Streptomyces sp. RM72]|uniref:hypothetical protein n=1 Tax=Streptomyces sp. RM72 TaxID=1115510 RepID=UPI001B38A7C9|nr:hypothetical protein [Streptomyces sp. RM72]MBQ0890467.1 hypothetical protein [Streptomyces sp. RM72]
MLAVELAGTADAWIGALAGIFVGLSTSWIAHRSGNPKRRLTWVQRLNVSVLRVEGSSSVTVTHATGPVPEARVAEITISNEGKKDVHPEDFTLGNDSLIFDFSVPVVEVLAKESDPPTAPIPETEIDGSKLKISKAPIARAQSISYTLLLNGPKENVRLLTQSLRDTPVRTANLSARRWRRWGLAVVVTFAASALSAYALSLVLPGGDSIYDKYNNCRYWDLHDPQKAADKCPPIKKP